MDYNIIFQKTNAIFRYAKISDTRLPSAIKEFYQEGIKNPGVAKHLGYINYAKYIGTESAIYKDPIFIMSEGLGNIFKSFKNMMLISKRVKAEVAKDSDLKTLSKAFEDKFKETYPKTAKIRIKIMKSQMDALVKIIFNG